MLGCLVFWWLRGSLFVCLFVCLFVYLLVCLSFCRLSVCLFVCVSVCLCLSVCFWFSISLYIGLSTLGGHLNSTVWSPLASFDLRNGWPTFNVYCEFASLLGSLALCGKLPCDNHAAQVEVKAALKYEGEKKTLYGGRGKALPSSAWRWAGRTFGHTLALHFGLNCAARRKISGFSGTHGSSPGHGLIFCVLMGSVTYTFGEKTLVEQQGGRVFLLQLCGLKFYMCNM